MKAIWNGEVVAESTDTIVIEGNHYFPAESIKKDFFKSSQHESFCPWKGKASYYHLEVGGKKNENAVWYYAEPKQGAADIKGRVAFWKGVEVVA